MRRNKDQEDEENHSEGGNDENSDNDDSKNDDSDDNENNSDSDNVNDDDNDNVNNKNNSNDDSEGDGDSDDEGDNEDDKDSNDDHGDDNDNDDDESRKRWYYPTAWTKKSWTDYKPIKGTEGMTKLQLRKHLLNPRNYSKTDIVALTPQTTAKTRQQRVDDLIKNRVLFF